MAKFIINILATSSILSDLQFSLSINFFSHNTSFLLNISSKEIAVSQRPLSISHFLMFYATSFSPLFGFVFSPCPFFAPLLLFVFPDLLYFSPSCLHSPVVACPAFLSLYPKQTWHSCFEIILEYLIKISQSMNRSVKMAMTTFKI